MFSILTSLALVALHLGSTAASCARGVHWLEARDTKHIVIPSWNYGTTTGPLNWHNMDPKYHLCGNGTTQSPINLNSTSVNVKKGSVALDIPYAKNVELENLGTTVEVVLNGTLTLFGNSTWNLVQFHFHTPSEHRVDWGHFDAEVHFVFVAADGSRKISVLGFFIDAAAWRPNYHLENALAQLDEVIKPGAMTHIPELDLSEFAKKASQSSYRHYMGSLTTPPCSERVAFYIATTPLRLSVSTYHKLRNIMGMNARYTQNRPGSKDILEIASQYL